MSGIPLTATSAVWPQFPDSITSYPSTTAPIHIGGNDSTDLPTVSNPNLPLRAISAISSIPPPVPQPPSIPFPSFEQPTDLTTSILSNISPATQTDAPFNQMATNSIPNLIQNFQNELNDRRLVRLEDENSKRRNTAMNIEQMGVQVLQSQRDIQEQILQYQLMLDQCIQSLDHQSFVLTGQSEELAFLRTKMSQFEYLIDALRQRKEDNQHSQNKPRDTNCIDSTHLCSRNPLSMRTPSMPSLFTIGGITRVRSSRFQPLNPHHQPTSASLNESQNVNLPVPNSNVTTSQMSSHPMSNMNN
ncbi:hypothetical protein I4U23_026261 [Adineta vaga]|uniref:Uncharacterized protein n=1 Tax=Adineta vaga TaxID=104782 RepID=B3G3Y4_ADIVA|nr:hypothetical protein [Adineta vaga]UJR23241.1 hypothetical protein I4U23_026261 [Adineta vaga]